MLTNLMYVTIHVTDQDRALRFYTEQLGLESRLDARGPDLRFLTVAVPGSPVEFVLWPHPEGAGRPAAAQQLGTPGPVFLESDDLRGDFTALRARGVPFDQPEPEEYAFGLRIEAVDPDGNRISLRQRGGPAGA